MASRKRGRRWEAHLGGLQAASADEAGPEDALIAQDASAGVLHAVQERAEIAALRLVGHHLPPLPADLQRNAPGDERPGRLLAGKAVHEACTHPDA